ncbi:MAG: hypothetical protein DRJ51_03410 [Thermoprotei archaeon]|nr:MAG: hypothetical protein DRJ51_03410 [Thermoprotei archaeon]RLE99126.1 MAG: hypothetical protein DRJ59_08230 [Thermoprotei archaeon]
MKTALIVLLLLVVFSSPLTSALSNPIPVPTLIFEREDITIGIQKVSEEELIVEVVGVYYFKNVNFTEVRMYFPLPPEALKGEIKVYLDGRAIAWKLSEKTYDTLLGNFPMIYWKISNIPKEFTVKVKYRYSIFKHKDGYRILYAMATGRFLNNTYGKQCIAEVKFNITGAPNSWIARVAFVPPPSEAFRAKYESEMEIPATLLNYVILRKASRPFKGLDRDLMIIIFPSGERWVRYAPKKGEIELTLNTFNNGTLEAVVRFVFRHSGFKVDVVKGLVEGTNVILELSVWEWTGPALQVITVKTIRKRFHKLKPGRYNFLLRINERNYMSQEFEIKGSSLDLTRLSLILATSLIAIFIALYIVRKRYMKR